MLVEEDDALGLGSSSIFSFTDDDGDEISSLKKAQIRKKSEKYDQNIVNIFKQ